MSCGELLSPQGAGRQRRRAGRGAGAILAATRRVIYNYFDDRVDLVAKAIMAYARDLITGVPDLSVRAGRATVTVNLLLFTAQMVSAS